MIGIQGGTFDPVHNGHLLPARAVMRSLGLSQLRFIPNRRPPHRPPPWLPAERRLALLEMALADIPGFILDRRELQRPGPSYMVDTLASLQVDFPAESLGLILGMDALAGFENWHDWQGVLRRCHLLVTHRPGHAPRVPDALKSAVVDDKAALLAAKAGKILLLDAPQLDISATRLRQALQQSDEADWRQMLAQWMPKAAAEQLTRWIIDDRHRA